MINIFIWQAANLRRHLYGLGTQDNPEGTLGELTFHCVVEKLEQPFS